MKFVTRKPGLFRSLRMPASWSLILSVVGLACAIALLPLPYVVMLIGVVFLAVLTLIDPIWALYGAVLSVTLQELVQLPGGLTYTQALFGVTAGAWGLRVLAYPQRPVVFGRLWPGLVVLVVALLLATATTPYSQNEALKETVRWFSVLLVYLLALNSLTHTWSGSGWRWRAVGLVLCLLLAPTASALLGLWQFFTATGPASFAIADGRFVRAYGTIGKPNSFAGYLNMAWPLAVALALGAWNQLRIWHRQVAVPSADRRVVVLAALFFSGVAASLVAALGASFSRGGWLGALAGGMVLVAAVLAGVNRTLRRRFWGAIGMAGVVTLAFLVLGGAALLPQVVVQRTQSIVQNMRIFDVRTVTVTPENFAIVERMSHLQAAWAMFSRYPLTGVGPGNYTVAYEGQETRMPPFAIHPWYTSRGHAHNYYLNIAAEAGIFGFAAYLFLLSLLAAQAYGTLRRSYGWFWRSVAVGGCGIIAAVAVHNLFENLHVLNMGMQLGALWGLLAVVEQNADWK